MISTLEIYLRVVLAMLVWAAVTLATLKGLAAVERRNSRRI